MTYSLIHKLMFFLSSAWVGMTPAIIAWSTRGGARVPITIVNLLLCGFWCLGVVGGSSNSYRRKPNLAPEKSLVLDPQAANKEWGCEHQRNFLEPRIQIETSQHWSQPGRNQHERQRDRHVDPKQGAD